MNKTVCNVLKVFLIAVFFFPIIWIFLSSFKNQSELFTYPLTMLPADPSLENYKAAFKTEILSGILTTLFLLRLFPH